MNDQNFVNAYIRILNDTLTDAFSKNLVMQAQLEAAKQNIGRVGELEAKIKELTDFSSDNNALLGQLSNMKTQLEHVTNQMNSKNAHVETFKRELVDARAQLKNVESEHLKVIDALNAEIGLLKTEVEELKSKKKKNIKALNNSTLENSILISDDSTF